MDENGLALVMTGTDFDNDDIDDGLINKNVIDSIITSGSSCDVTPPSTNDIQLRQRSFKWDKPPDMAYQDLSASAKLAVALTLEDDLRQRDLVIRLLSKQLRRSHEEKYKLLQELNSYRGSDRDTLYNENCVLRQRISRVTRQNLVLQARDAQHRNLREATQPGKTNSKAGGKSCGSNSLGSRMHPF